jgi:hypothetical protein
MNRITLTTALILILSVNIQAQKTKKVVINDTLTVKAKQIVSDDFDNGLEDWKVEQMPGGKVFQNENDKLEIEDAGGCTVWYKHKLNGPLMIEYDAYVIKADGIYDRASDLNCFWMATDPEFPDDFFKNSARRGGRFPNYDYLALYYVGTGGHNNSKTRFRRYSGTGEKPLLPEYDYSDKKYLITPNVLTKIRLIAYKGIIQYYRDGELYYNFYDPEPYTSGYFGIRTVHNHMTVDNFKVYKLKE